MQQSFENLFSIRGKVALVTGGSRGIGEMISAGFLAHGAKVYISSRKAPALDETAKRLSLQYGGECIPLSADLSQLSGAESLANQLKEREERLDILVNNAGGAWEAKLEDFPEVGWDKVMDTNVKGVFFLTQKLMPLLREAASRGEPARVINIGSIDAMRTAEFNSFSYGASKAALHQLTRFMAGHFTKERILFNAIAPGLFPTWLLSNGVGFGGITEDVDWESVGTRVPNGRVGEAPDIAGLAIFLASRAGEYVIGQTIVCDGGVLAAT